MMIQDASNLHKSAFAFLWSYRTDYMDRPSAPDQILCAAELAIKHWQLGDNEAH
jgi:hypothetical protein